MGQMLFAAFIATPIGVVIGVVIGDVSFYMTRKFSILALVTAFLLAFSAMYLWCFLMYLRGQVTIPWAIYWALLLGITIIPPLVAYNAVSFLSRKYWSKRAEIVGV